MQTIKIYSLCSLILLLASCGNRGGNIETFIYSTPNVDSIRIPKHAKDFKDFLRDSLDYMQFKDGVYAMLSYKPEETFTYPFESAGYGSMFRVFSTSDSMMRFYSFRMNDYDDASTLIQFKDSDGNVHLDYFVPNEESELDVLWKRLPPPHLSEEEECNYTLGEVGIVDDVNTIRDDRGNTFYLIHFITPCPTPEAYHYIVALNKTDGVPQKVPLFNTGKKRVDMIETYIEYSHSGRWENEDSMFVYNPTTKDLYIPHIKDCEFQNNYLIYHFDGVEFKYVRIR